MLLLRGGKLGNDDMDLVSNGDEVMEWDGGWRAEVMNHACLYLR